jgi:hypothetical protein
VHFAFRFHPEKPTPFNSRSHGNWRSKYDIETGWVPFATVVRDGAQLL